MGTASSFCGLKRSRRVTHEQEESNGNRINRHRRIGGGSSLCEPYLYKLGAVNATGDKAEIEFGTSRELRQDAFIKLDLQPIRGVVGWSEVTEDALPANVAEALA